MKKSILILLLLMITTLSVRADQFNLEPSLGLVAGSMAALNFQTHEFQVFYKHLQPRPH